MNVSNQVAEFVVPDAEAAKELLDRETRRFMMPFMAEATTVKSAAMQLLIDEKQVRNKVAKLRRLGLLVEVQSDISSRAKYYIAAGACFNVPFESTPFVNLAEMMLYLSNWETICGYYEPVLNSVFKGDWYLKLFPVEHESFLNAEFYNTAPPLQPKSIWSGAGDYLNLTHDDAASLKEELEEIRERYLKIAGNNPGQQEYFLHLHLVPRPSTD